MLTIPFLDFIHIEEKSNNLKIKYEELKEDKIVFNSPKNSTYYSIIKNNNEMKLYHRFQTNHNVKVTLYNYEFTNVAIYDNNKEEFINDKTIFKKNGISHNFYALDKKIDNNYIGIGGVYSIVLPSSERTMNLFSSTDGLNWVLKKKLFSPKDSLKQNYSTHFDSLNTLLYDNYEKEYRLYARYNKIGGVRLSQVITSKNLIDWDNFKLCSFDKNEHNIYIANVIQYPNSFLFLSLTNIKGNTCIPFSEISLSYNGVIFKVKKDNILNDKKYYRTIPFINIINNNFYLYFDFYNENKVMSYKLRKDGFSSIMTTSDIEEYLLFKKLLLYDKNIIINYKTFDDGYIKIILYDINNNIIDTTENMHGDFVDLLVKWKNDFEIDNINVKIKILMKNVKLYSITLNTDYKNIKNVLCE